MLIEGTTERLLLPKIIGMIDATQPKEKKLGSQYLSVIEVGGAYAHIFFDLLEFLEVRTLVITDIDSVKPNDKSRLIACPVGQGTKTSNACIKAWFDKPDIAPADLLKTDDAAKIASKRRIAYQLPEQDGGPCGRSFEDAFMLANASTFVFAGPSNPEKEAQAWEEAKEVKKSEFALQHALSDQAWHIPRYIREGLVWLADLELPPAATVPTVVKVVI